MLSCYLYLVMVTLSVQSKSCSLGDISDALSQEAETRYYNNAEKKEIMRGLKRTAAVGKREKS